MSSLFFNLHLLGAGATIVLVVVTAYRLVKNNRYRKPAAALAVVGSWQLLTGIGLVAATPGISISRICVSGAIYLVIVGTIEGLVVKRLYSATAG